MSGTFATVTGRGERDAETTTARLVEPSRSQADTRLSEPERSGGERTRGTGWDPEPRTRAELLDTSTAGGGGSDGASTSVD